MDFVINLDKPKGITSQEAVLSAKRITRAKKAGHAGTLDPLATGVLLVCINEATKTARFLSDMDKEYIAQVKLGERTDTFDSDGRIIKKVENFSFKEKDAEDVLKMFMGDIRQTPPMYSAIKIGGTPLYKLARKGVSVERSPRLVTVHKIEMTEFSPPMMEIKVSCTKGTYIRTLCDDIGEALGSGAHITGLRRTRIGNFSADDSLSFEGLQRAARSNSFARISESSCADGILTDKAILPIDDALSHIIEYRVPEKDLQKARNGMPVQCPDSLSMANGLIRLKGPAGHLFAIGMKRGNIIRIERMIHSGIE